ncbi:hypothetical protein Q3O60_03460 [Alkalimonas collagenimarina]|uniref:Secreted protein n=1 Tax=Alkalimonas collagenimarina TaxID=400390 RepID=A0ABT9GW03_9GAMM|nr:hypothetical protein [Alkalimonas collagenimarina]MDP4535246.1 hypothetical protein [Alkalimonas collagenimarina]
MKILLAAIGLSVLLILAAFFINSADDLTPLGVKSELSEKHIANDEGKHGGNNAEQTETLVVQNAASNKIEAIDANNQASERELWIQTHKKSIFKNEKCRLVQSYETEAEFITEMHAFAGDVDDHRLKEDFEHCRDYEPMTWPELESKYISLVNSGVREAELILASVLPNGMTNGRRWVLKASTWSEQAADLLINNFEDFRFDEDHKYFLSLVLPLDQLLNIDMSTLSSHEIIHIDDLASRWNSGTENEKREVLEILFDFL